MLNRAGWHHCFHCPCPKGGLLIWVWTCLAHDAVLFCSLRTSNFLSYITVCFGVDPQAQRSFMGVHSRQQQVSQ